MSTVLKAEGHADLLALVPALLGYKPRNSVVVVPFSGSRTHGALRLDLVTGARSDELADCALTLVSRIPGVTAVVLVVYGSNWKAEPIREAFEALTDGYDLLLLDALYVDEGMWGFIGSSESQGTVGEVPDVVSSLVVDGDQSSGASLPEVSPELVQAVASQSGAPLEPHRAVALFESALWWEPDDLRPDDVVALAAALNRAALRDVALVQWARGVAHGRDALRVQLTHDDESSTPESLGEVLFGEGPRPEAARLEAALAVCRYVAAAVAQESRPGPLTAAAWLSWALGRSTHASIYVDRVLAIAPEHGMAALIRQMLAAGRLPAWAFKV